MMVRRILVGIVFFSAAGVLLFNFARAVQATSTAEKSVCNALEPQVLDVQAPDFSLPCVDGKMWGPKDFRGKPFLLHFWATWCPPCVEELPSLHWLSRKVAGDVDVITVSVDENADIARAFTRQHRISDLTVLMDPSRKVPLSYGTEKYPESFLIDAEGKIRYRFVNKRMWASEVAERCLRSL